MVFPSGDAAAQTAAKPLAVLKQAHEVTAIRRALTASGGNAAQAARRLGISPQLLNYKLKRLGIDRLVFKQT